MLYNAHMTIRAFVPNDNSAVYLLFQSYPEMFDIPELEEIKNDLLLPDNPRLVRVTVVENDLIIGYAQASIPKDTDFAWKLDWIVIKKEFRTQGMGTKLLSDLESIVGHKKAKGLIVETLKDSSEISVSAQKFYSKNGYIQVGIIPDYWTKGEAKVIYYKKL